MAKLLRIIIAATHVLHVAFKIQAFMSRIDLNRRKSHQRTRFPPSLEHRRAPCLARGGARREEALKTAGVHVVLQAVTSTTDLSIMHSGLLELAGCLKVASCYRNQDQCTIAVTRQYLQLPKAQLWGGTGLLYAQCRIDESFAH